MPDVNNQLNIPKVSIIIVALNEEKALPKLLDDLQQQSFDHQQIEIILVDGMSRDNTRTIMDEFASSNDFNHVLCLNNEKIIQASGWNVALTHVTGEIVIRLDSHASIPEDFVEKNVKLIEEGHDICGGKVLNYIPDKTKWSSVVNMAEDSMFGGSVAAFRHKDEAGYVDTLAFCAYKKEIFDKVGFFDERLLRSEDNEMHYRMRQAGYRFYYTPEIVSYRETRPTFKKLLKQKVLNGYWVGLTSGVCPQCFSLYHFIPFLFVLGIIITSVFAFFGIWQLAAIMWSLYLICNLVMSVSSFITAKDRFVFCIALPVIFLLLHVGYGIGTLIGLINIPKLRKKTDQ